ncbi:MAG: hypothetical protein DKINENOH_01961 [bacterium]|nr:hypothetical protein [bacterium]
MSAMNTKSHTIACIGGTFDALHVGHKEYIQMAFAAADFVLIYLASNRCVQREKKYDVRSYRDRCQRLKSYLTESNIAPDRYQIRQIKSRNQLENELAEENVHKAIVVAEYVDMITRINEKRRTNGLPPIQMIRKERTRDDHHHDISSTEMRFPKSIRSYIPNATLINIDTDKIKSTAAGKFLQKYNLLAFCKALPLKP